MSLKKDKQKVLGEVFDDERIKSFFDTDTPEGVNADFNLLEKSYRGMKAENFGTFLDFFIERGHDINAQNPEGDTLLSLVQEHKQGEPYALALSQHGAK